MRVESVIFLGVYVHKLNATYDCSSSLKSSSTMYMGSYIILCCGAKTFERVSVSEATFPILSSTDLLPVEHELKTTTASSSRTSFRGPNGFACSSGVKVGSTEIIFPSRTLKSPHEVGLPCWLKVTSETVSHVLYLMECIEIFSA